MAQLLGDPNCRLLTLVGPGGVGKTRLAIEAASYELRRAGGVGPVRVAGASLATHHSFPDGVYFVPLAAVSAPLYIIPAIASAIGFSFSGQQDTQTQLFNYLRPKQMLLIADNLEHLLATSGLPGEALAAADVGIELLLDLLQAAPVLKILATAREPLNLPGEWLFDLHGLRTPDPVSSVLPAEQSEAGLATEAYAALTLFVQVARRVNSAFVLSPKEHAAVARICHLVDGLPLGIELAASWVRALSCQEIADEIQHNVAFLSTTQRGIPPRHRSILAVFDYSWQLLAEEEQRVLAGLAVFRGGFTREAAAAVTGATLPLLSTLIAKSLLRRSGEQRYDLHELVRQYAASKLALDPSEQVAVHHRYSEYFLTLLASRQAVFTSSRQKAAIAECSLELGNIRQAWQWAVETEQYDLLRAAVWTLFYFFDLRNYFREGEATFRRTQTLLQAQLPLTTIDKPGLAIMQGIMSTYQSFFAIRLGRLTEGMARLSETITLFRQNGDEAALLVALTVYGLGCIFTGKFVDAATCYREARLLSERLEWHWYITWSRILLGITTHELGDYAEAYRWFGEGVAASRKLGDPQAISNGITMMARTAQVLSGKGAKGSLLHEAQSLALEARQLAQETEDRFSFVIATEQLALITDALGDADEAWRLLEECCTHFRQVGGWSLARLLNHMGNIALRQTNLPEAKHYFSEAMTMAMQINVLPYVLDALVGLAALFAQAQPAELALALAEVVDHHPAATQEARSHAARLTADLTTGLNPVQVAAAQARFQGHPLDAVIAEVLALPIAVNQ